jgi:Gcd10p family
MEKTLRSSFIGISKPETMYSFVYLVERSELSRLTPKGKFIGVFVALRISHDRRGEKSLNLGKFGIFRPKLLIGQPYGLSYEIQADRTLKVLPPRRLEEFGTYLLVGIEYY